jgi:hypothetical protein
MSRRLFAVSAVLVFTALSAFGADPARARDAALPVEAALPFDEGVLSALFDLAPGVIENDGDGVTVSAFAVEVVLARIDENGDLIKACVSSEEEARKFLTLPLEKLDRKGGHQQ